MTENALGHWMARTGPSLRTSEVAARRIDRLVAGRSLDAGGDGVRWGGEEPDSGPLRLGQKKEILRGAFIARRHDPVVIKVVAGCGRLVDARCATVGYFGPGVRLSVPIAPGGSRRLRRSDERLRRSDS